MRDHCQCPPPPNNAVMPPVREILFVPDTQLLLRPDHNLTFLPVPGTASPGIRVPFTPRASALSKCGTQSSDLLANMGPALISYLSCHFISLCLWNGHGNAQPAIEGRAAERPGITSAARPSLPHTLCVHAHTQSSAFGLDSGTFVRVSRLSRCPPGHPELLASFMPHSSTSSQTELGTDVSLLPNYPRGWLWLAEDC